MITISVLFGFIKYQEYKNNLAQNERSRALASLRATKTLPSKGPNPGFGEKALLKIKYNSGKMYYQFEVVSQKNLKDDFNFIIYLLDKDGFKITELIIPDEEIFQSNNSNGQKSGYLCNSSLIMDEDEYKSVNNWTMILKPKI